MSAAATDPSRPRNFAGELSGSRHFKVSLYPMDAPTQGDYWATQNTVSLLSNCPNRDSTMKSLSVLALSFMLFAFVGNAFADGDKGTPEEAKALAIKAADYLKANGPEKAYPAFEAKDNATFHDRDLYVYVMSPEGKMLSHGTNPGLIGKVLLELKDVDSKPFVHDIVAVKDTGWVSYKWQNPTTKAVEPKTAYVMHVGDAFVIVGAYAN
jgi:cytochrome c